jgi:hypothetical protein
VLSMARSPSFLLMTTRSTSPRTCRTCPTPRPARPEASRHHRWPPTGGHFVRGSAFSVAQLSSVATRHDRCAAVGRHRRRLGKRDGLAAPYHRRRGRFASAWNNAPRREAACDDCPAVRHGRRRRKARGLHARGSPGSVVSQRSVIRAVPADLGHAVGPGDDQGSRMRVTASGVSPTGRPQHGTQHVVLERARARAATRMRMTSGSTTAPGGGRHRRLTLACRQSRRQQGARCRDGAPAAA